MFLIMDINRMNEPSDRDSVSSLGSLYTDFDGWVAKYNSWYERSTYLSKETSTKEDQTDAHQNREDILENDVFFGDLLLRHRRHIRSAKTPATPCFNFYKENDGFVFYDHVFYRLMDKNGDKRIVYQCIRSKL